ncbi:MAG: SDR family oxidoreductase, partial [Pseudomonadales bacterium]|nr:SDR family oxidoreductase [Pseudomonadales bacterium]
NSNRIGKAIGQRCDISKLEDVKQAVQDCKNQLGSIDVLINVAGILKMAHTDELSDEIWHSTLAINLTGTFYLCRESLPHLIESKGNIVNVSSTSALKGLPWGAAYAASKGGVSAMTKAIAVEYAKRGVRANTVCPGSILTNMQSQAPLPENADMSLIPRLSSLDKFRGPEAVASVIALLASESDGAHITGAQYVIDGGTTA